MLIPIGGRGQRFRDNGIEIPKPLIEVAGKRIIDWSLDSIDLDKFDITFILREDNCKEYDLDKILLDKVSGARVIQIEGQTRGAVDTCLLAKEFLGSNPLAIFTLDVYFEPHFDGLVRESLDGCILTFSSSSTNYSYSKTKEDLVVEVAEKKVISNDASAGIYWFKSGDLFLDACKEYMTRPEELHVAPLYNILIKNGHKVGIQPVDKFYVMGVPKEAEFMEDIISTSDVIGIVSDHSGFYNKKIMRDILIEKDITFIDYGCYNYELCDYSDYIPNSCRDIQNKRIKFVFGFCRSGQGVSITANKHKGVRSAVIYDEDAMPLAIQHNAANFFAVPDRMGGKDKLEMLLNMALKESFSGGRHQSRLMKLNDYR